ncbi:hypothetical protein CKJ89_09655 [Klebsiella pneumoniae]|nr:hypothetical protein CKJ89_09655 [Klebsiella pneumoniae]
MSVLTFPSVLTVSETTVAVIVDAFGRQVNTCQSGNSVVTFDARNHNYHILIRAFRKIVPA